MEKKAKSETNKITFVFLFLLLIIYSSNAQQEEFIRGVFIHSGEGALTLYGNYDQVQLMGTNSVHQMVVREVPRLGQTDNFQQLSRFNYIYASNDSGTGSENCDWCNAEPENIDWISYFTQAKYMKWEAEGDSIFNGSVGIKHQGGEFYQEADGTKGWKTSDNNIGDTVIYGPNYWQYPRYTFTNPAWNPTPINYKVNFRMKIDFPSSETLPVCIIMVLMTKPSTGYSKILDIDTLTTDILNTAYQNFTLSYNYKDYIIFEGIVNSSGIHPATITKPFSEIETNPSLNIGSEVQFIVKWLGNRQLFIDYIEVYDEKIWEYYFINRISQTKNAIRDYNLSFSSNPNLYEKLKYYVTIDEPHSIDCYIPIKRVQEIMDSLNIDKNLLVHWYPGWSHYRDGTNTWPLYYQLAKPKKINFWYAPFVSDENGNNTANDFTLYWFQRNLQQAHLQQNDFFVTLQTFGWRDKQTNLFYGYRTPTPEEISAETMLALAHGIKGLFYEHYYSIRNMEFGGRYYIVDGLVDTLQNGVFPLTPRWNKVEAIFNRLKGALGKALMNLDYNSSYLQLRRYIHEPTTESVNKHYLTLSEVSLEGFPKIDFHAGFLEDKNKNDNKFFLLTNQITVGNRLVELILTKPVAGFYNYRFRNVEPQYNLDTTYQNTFTTTLNFPAGEGYLYQVAPVVKYGGKLAYNDTIKSNTTLSDDMRINNNVNLIINRGKYYTIQDTVTLVGTGFITGAGYLNIAQGGEIKIVSWSKSVFKGREGNHPKIYWGKFPNGQNVISYRIYRRKGETNFVLAGTVSSNSPRYFIDNTITILDRPEPFATFAEYKVTAIYQNGDPITESDYSNTIRYDEVDGIAIDKSASGYTATVTEYKLEQNYPNPFNPTTRIKYSIKERQLVQLKIFDVLGRELFTLEDNYKEPGYYETEFDASSLSSGVYIYRLSAGDFVDVKKMIVVK